jgi:hypothetical protein
VPPQSSSHKAREESIALRITSPCRARPTTGSKFAEDGDRPRFSPAASIAFSKSSKLVSVLALQGTNNTVDKNEVSRLATVAEDDGTSV